MLGGSGASSSEDEFYDNKESEIFKGKKGRHTGVCVCVCVCLRPLVHDSQLLAG